MLSTFNDPTQIFTDSETKVETYVQGMPNFTTRVKKWDETLPEDAWADENFPWDTAHIEVNDTLEIKKGNASHCEERKFTLSVASSETDPLAARLLQATSDDCDNARSCFYMNSTDNYRMRFWLRVSEDDFEYKTFTYTLTTEFRKYTDEGPPVVFTSPQGVFTFTVYIGPCLVTRFEFNPTEEMSFSYYTWETMTPLTFTVNRFPNCAIVG